MRVVSRGTLRAFWRRHPDAEGPLKAWFAEVSRETWNAMVDIKRHYATASMVDNERVVFNIGGNKYRLAVKLWFGVGGSGWNGARGAVCLGSGRVRFCSRAGQAIDQYGLLLPGDVQAKRTADIPKAVAREATQDAGQPGALRGGDRVDQLVLHPPIRHRQLEPFRDPDKFVTRELP